MRIYLAKLIYKAFVVILAVASGALTAGSAVAAVAPIANPAGGYQPAYPTIQTPAGGSGTEQPMRKHGIRIPVPRCMPTTATPC